MARLPEVEAQAGHRFRRIRFDAERGGVRRRRGRRGGRTLRLHSRREVAAARDRASQPMKSRIVTASASSE